MILVIANIMPHKTPIRQKSQSIFTFVFRIIIRINTQLNKSVQLQNNCDIGFSVAVKTYFCINVRHDSQSRTMSNWSHFPVRWANCFVVGEIPKSAEYVLTFTVFPSGMNSSILSHPSPPVPSQPPPSTCTLNII